MRPEHGGNEKLPAFLASVPDRGRCAIFCEPDRKKMVVRGEHRRGDMNDHGQYPGAGCSRFLQDATALIETAGFTNGVQVSQAPTAAIRMEPRHTHQYSGQKPRYSRMFAPKIVPRRFAAGNGFCHVLKVSGGVETGGQCSRLRRAAPRTPQGAPASYRAFAGRV